MRENRQSGSEGGGTETNRFSLPLSGASPGFPGKPLGPLARLKLHPFSGASGEPGTGVLGLWRSRKYPGTSEIQRVRCGLPGNLKWLRV